MNAQQDGKALIYCEGAFGGSNGKTAHGLVRHTRRYQVLGVVDSLLVGRDAGEVLDGQSRGIPIYAGIEAALTGCAARGHTPTHMVMGLAPDGGRLGERAREDVRLAIRNRLNVDSGLHTFLGEDEELSRLAAVCDVTLRDVRRPPPRDTLHFFSGAIERVSALRVAVLGTDSAVGKRTTAWELVEGLEARGVRAELVGTGQTAWMQGARYSVIFDALVNDFVTGEIEDAIVRCDGEARPDVIVIEGQGSLMNPAYPGGFEILAAGRPHMVVLQDAPARQDYDGFPGYPIHPLDQQLLVTNLLSGDRVCAVTINHEGIREEEIPAICAAIEQETGLPTCDVLRDGPGRLVALIQARLDEHRRPTDATGGPSPDGRQPQAA